MPKNAPPARSRLSLTAFCACFVRKGDGGNLLLRLGRVRSRLKPRTDREAEGLSKILRLPRISLPGAACAERFCRPTVNSPGPGVACPSGGRDRETAKCCCRHEAYSATCGLRPVPLEPSQRRKQKGPMTRAFLCYEGRVSHLRRGVFRLGSGGL